MSSPSTVPLIEPPIPLNIVLVSPEIPPNTGNVARLCACTGSRLHLVCPLGFSLTDKDLRRAGLDYWDKVHAQTWASLEEWEEGMELQGAGRTRLHLFTARGVRSHVQARYQPGDILVFGRESRGLPHDFLDRYADRTVCLPMGMSGRSLNLASSAAIATYEALRQLGAFGPV